MPNRACSCVDSDMRRSKLIAHRHGSEWHRHCYGRHRILSNVGLFMWTIYYGTCLIVYVSRIIYICYIREGANSLLIVQYHIYVHGHLEFDWPHSSIIVCVSFVWPIPHDFVPSDWQIWVFPSTSLITSCL